MDNAVTHWPISLMNIIIIYIIIIIIQIIITMILIIPTQQITTIILIILTQQITIITLIMTIPLMITHIIMKVNTDQLKTFLILEY